jgi:hypothetical protein
VVAAAGAAAYLAGLWLIAGPDFPLVWRLALAGCWCADAAFALVRFRSAACDLELIRVCPGSITVLGPSGLSDDAWLLTGSIVMRRVAWLRLASAGGKRSQVLFLARWTDPGEWHRLQLVWQLREPGFGHPGGP